MILCNLLSLQDLRDELNRYAALWKQADVKATTCEIEELFR